MSLAERVQEEARKALSDLGSYIALPSVAAQGRGIEEASAYVKELLSGLGAEVKVFSDHGNPLVYARIQGRRDETLLFYDHYDVQPEEPVDLWNSSPFELTERDGLLIGRGVADNKGDLIARVAAIRALLSMGDLPISVAFLVEGEEEIGSPSIEAEVHAHLSEIRADYCIWEAGGVDVQGRPGLTGGVKGILYVDLLARTSDRDLHSSVAPVVENAAWRLAEALTAIRPEAGRVAIPGFHEAVQPLPQTALDAIAVLEGDEETMFAMLEGTTRRKVDRPVQAFFSEPTCTICGFTSGYGGAGPKTVLPAEARAKLDFRLVPGQDPGKIYDDLRRFLDAKGFTDVETRMVVGEAPYVADPDHPFVETLRASMRETYGKDGVYHPLAAGSGPMHAVAGQLGIPCVSIGCGYDGSRAHSPNENIRLEDFLRGAQAIAGIITALGR